MKSDLDPMIHFLLFGSDEKNWSNVLVQIGYSVNGIIFSNNYFYPESMGTNTMLSKLPTIAKTIPGARLA